MLLFRNVFNTRIIFLNLFFAATATNNKDKLVNDTMNEVISQYSNWFTQIFIQDPKIFFSIQQRFIL